VNVHIDSQTRQILTSLRPEPDAALRIAVMDEGCGCGSTVGYEINWDIPLPDDVRLKVEELTVVVDPHSLHYFDTPLFLEHHPDTRTFRLKSPNQIYVSNLAL
jgi:Fe-S cluster assembly iron-binding protein IscA